MASMLKAISLLLIGGGIGAYAAGGGENAVNDTSKSGGAVASSTSTTVRQEAPRAEPDGAQMPRVQASPYVLVGEHQALAARASNRDDRAEQRSGNRTPVRMARATGRMQDAQPPTPAMRPILVGTGQSQTAVNTGPSAEARLAEAIQKELKRVGCYTGNIDGDWGPDTRRAMRAFNDRVNATLPIEQPDYILLTLLQGHAAKACGAACPLGQEVSSNGKCLPRSVIAEERRRLMTGPTAASQAPKATALSVNATATTTAVPSASGRASASAAPPRNPSRAEIARQRIEAAEASRKQAAAEVAARKENERLDRLAAKDKAREAAEARRLEEIAALAARAATRAAAAAATRPSPPLNSVATGSVATSPPPPLPARPSPAFRQQVVASRDTLTVEVEAARPQRHTASRRDRQRRPPEARYAGQFAPAYRVGRLPATQVRGYRMYEYAPAPRPANRGGYNPQRIFRDLQYRMP